MKMTWEEFAEEVIRVWQGQKHKRSVEGTDQRKLSDEIVETLNRLAESFISSGESKEERHLRSHQVFELGINRDCGGWNTQRDVLSISRAKLEDKLQKQRQLTIEKLVAEERETLRKTLKARYLHSGILESITRLTRKGGKEYAFLRFKGDGRDYALFDLNLIKNAKTGDEAFFSLRQTDRGNQVDDLRVIPSDTPSSDAPPSTLPERKPERSSIEKKLAKAAFGVVTERSLNYLASMGCETAQCGLVGLTTKEKWLLDCVVDAITKDDKFRQDPKLYALDHSQFVEVVGSREILEDLALWFSFTDDDVRKITSRKDLTGQQIGQMFRKILNNSSVEGRWKVFYDDRHWHEVELYGHVISDLKIDKYGQASRRKNIPEESKTKKKYTFRLGTIAGLYILSNLAKGMFKIFPREFYRMKLGSQEIYRYISTFEGSREGVNITYHALSLLLGLKQNTANPDGRIRQFKVYFDEVCEVIGLELKQKGRGESTVFHVHRKAAQLNPPQDTSR